LNLYESDDKSLRRFAIQRKYISKQVGLHSDEPQECYKQPGHTRESEMLKNTMQTSKFSNEYDLPDVTEIVTNIKSDDIIKESSRAIDEADKLLFKNKDIKTFLVKDKSKLKALCLPELKSDIFEAYPGASLTGRTSEPLINQNVTPIVSERHKTETWTHDKIIKWKWLQKTKTKGARLKSVGGMM
jgi:hypothetical protein